MQDHETDWDKGIASALSQFSSCERKKRGCIARVGLSDDLLVFHELKGRKVVGGLVSQQLPIGAIPNE